MDTMYCCSLSSHCAAVTLPSSTAPHVHVPSPSLPFSLSLIAVQLGHGDQDALRQDDLLQAAVMGWQLDAAAVRETL